MESYNEKIFKEKYGIAEHFVQDNFSQSKKNVLRGLHYQIQSPQGKLVRVISGSVFDVTVDLRKNSTTFGKWMGITLSAENREVMWIPKGFAHGFLVLSDQADFFYKTTDFYDPQGERCLTWCDPTLNIDWPIDTFPIVSPKDQQGKKLSEAELFE